MAAYQFERRSSFTIGDDTYFPNFAYDPMAEFNREILGDYYVMWGGFIGTENPYRLFLNYHDPVRKYRLVRHTETTREGPFTSLEVYSSTPEDENVYRLKSDYRGDHTTHESFRFTMGHLPLEGYLFDFRELVIMIPLMRADNLDLDSESKPLTITDFAMKYLHPAIYNYIKRNRFHSTLSFRFLDEDGKEITYHNMGDSDDDMDDDYDEIGVGDEFF